MISSPSNFSLNTIFVSTQHNLNLLHLFAPHKFGFKIVIDEVELFSFSRFVTVYCFWQSCICELHLQCVYTDCHITVNKIINKLKKHSSNEMSLASNIGLTLPHSCTRIIPQIFASPHNTGRGGEGRSEMQGLECKAEIFYFFFSFLCSKYKLMFPFHHFIQFVRQRTPTRRALLYDNDGSVIQGPH